MIVLHDRPPAFFGSTPLPVRHALFTRLEGQLRAKGVLARFEAATGRGVPEGGLSTLFTSATAGGDEVTLRPDRPALVISSTSWTEDEDFSILLEALVSLDASWQLGCRKGVARPFVVVVVTGKGPQKEMYEAKIAKLSLQRVAICTMWLEAEDYPLLMGAADLGVCLHMSTSGECVKCTWGGRSGRSGDDA